MRSQLLFILFVAVIFGDELSNTTTAIQIVGGNEELISLYDANDAVVELTDRNITQHIYDPNAIWFVEFYAHWCGHCKRFSPIWKALAREFDVPSWRRSSGSSSTTTTIVFAAINCAQQNCDQFMIPSTPTLRLFYGGSEGRPEGIDIPAVKDLEQLRETLLKNLEIGQAKGFIKSENLPNFLLVLRPKASGAPPGMASNKKMLAYIVENENRGVLGRDIVFHAHKAYTDLLEIRRIDWMSALNSITHFRGSSLPAVVMAPLRQKVPDWNSAKIVAPSPLYPTMANYRSEIMSFIDKVIASEVLGTGFVDVTTTTSTTSTTTQAPALTMSFSPPVNGQEVGVYMGDLEHALRYIVDKEISAQATLDELRLNAVYQLLESVLQYLPLRGPLRNFLITLRDWPIRMEFKSVTGQQYSDKVDELMTIYQPFKATPDDYVGCAGSEPHYRGYPCSLWQLFHSMMVNAAIKGDPSMVSGGPSTVAKTMVNYIYYFFSCRHCADNFRTKVNKLGFLPSNPRDSVLWLWQIHNMANVLLAGDVTEDPQHPKIVWPSEADCPNCRIDLPFSLSADPQIAFVDGQWWNLTALVGHNVHVYGTERLQTTLADLVDETQGVSNECFLVMEKLCNNSTQNLGP